MIHRDTILTILGSETRSTAEILRCAQNDKVELCIEDVQFVLRKLIEEDVVRQHAPEADGQPWRYSVRDPLFAQATGCLLLNTSPNPAKPSTSVEAIHDTPGAARPIAASSSFQCGRCEQQRRGLPVTFGKHHRSCAKTDEDAPGSVGTAGPAVRDFESADGALDERALPTEAFA